jgi:hypothetical protein
MYRGATSPAQGHSQKPHRAFRFHPAAFEQLEFYSANKKASTKWGCFNNQNDL